MQFDSASDRVRMNKQYWDAIAVRTQQEKLHLIEQIRRGAPYLEEIEPKLASYLSDIKGKKVIVLQFGDALVLLACAKKGALVTGVDLSSEQVRLARESAA
jgi:2-polyprenyl-3-methyl-5-hydroxy-6-metoxy-1,4-benzoquinol methylase